MDDIEPSFAQLYASFVKSTKANATVQNIDATAALVRVCVLNGYKMI